MKEREKLNVEWEDKLKVNERQLKEQMRKDNQDKEKKIGQLEFNLK